MGSYFLICLAMLSLLPVSVSAQTPGSVDASFVPGVDNGTVLAGAVQPDGKVVIGGTFTTVEGVSHASLARLNTDGSVDSGFNASTGSQVKNLAVLPDGSIIAAGNFPTANGIARIGLARFDSAGVLDVTFNALLDNNCNALAIQPDGRMIVGGDFANVGVTGRSRIARLTATGALDGSFDPGTGANGTVLCATLQPDGKVLIGGSFTQVNAVPRNRIARLNADGSLDATFDPGTGADFQVNNIEVQPDGQIIAVGSFLVFNGIVSPTVVRLNPNGSVESKSTFDIGSGASASVMSSRLQTDGKILIMGGFARWNENDTSRPLRLNPNGSRDNSFSVGSGGNGEVHVQLGDGRHVIGGSFTTFNGTARKRVVRVANGPASQTLQSLGATQVQWLRSGTAPEVQFVTFELSTDGGSNWTMLGNGTRIAGGWQLTGLSLPTTGKLRVRGRIPAGYNSGSGLLEQVADFDQAVTVPAISSPTSSSLTATSATLGGDVTSDGGSAITERGVVCVPTSISTSPAIGAPGVLKFTAAGTTGVFTTSATGLTPGVSYTLSAYAINGIGIGYSSAASFTTVSSVPLLTAPTVALVSSATATLGGTITATGGSAITERGVIYSRTSVNSNPQIGGTGVTVVPAAVATDVFTVLVGGLSSGVGYSFKAYATNSVGSGYTSPVTTFTTHGAPAGALDLPGFNPSGSYANCVAVQPDGKVLVGGFFSTMGGAAHANIARFNSDGTIDNSFTTTLNSTGVVQCLATLPDGKILIGGSFSNINGTARFGLARLNNDGSLDTGFTPALNNAVFCIEVQPDGAILIGGSFTTVNATPLARIARLTSAGALDATFDPGTGADSSVVDIAVDANGKILIGGSFANYNSTPAGYFARLESTGALESTATFNPGTGANSFVQAVTVQPDGKILLGGYFSTVNGVSARKVARLNADGSVQGAAEFKLSQSINTDVFALALQANGKIIVAGSFTQANGANHGGIIRLLADGSIESKSGFDAGTGASSNVNCVALQPGGKIWLAGNFTSFDTTPCKYVARLANDPATSLLSAVSASTAQWLRGDAGPELDHTKFELSTDGGTNWTALGNGARIGGGWQITGLSLPATGILRAYGPGGQGRASSVTRQDSTFDLSIAVPMIASPTSSNVTSNTATLGGDVTSEGGAPVTERGVVYSLTSASSDPQFGGPGVTKATASGTTGMFTVDVTSLSAASNYSFKAYAINSAGAAFTTTANFTTTAAPSVINPTSTSVGPVSATLGGTVSSDNGFAISERGIVFSAFGANADPVIGGPAVTKLTTTGTTGTFTLSATALPASTLFVFKAYAINSNGTGYSTSGSFTTAAPAVPAVSIQSFSSASGAGATFSVSVADNGAAVSEAGYVYSVTATNGNPVIGGLGVTKVIIGTGSGSFNTFLAGLAANTGYTVKAYAINNVGTTHSSASTFTTDAVTAGTLDLDYNPNVNGSVFASAPLPDGSMLIGGSFTTVGGVARTNLARLLPDGSLDSSFNPSTDSNVNAIAVQADGKIVIGGQFTMVNGIAQSRCARLLADGTLDNTFTAAADGIVWGVKTLPDGSILLVGAFTTMNGTPRGRIARLSAIDGGVDSGFASGIGADSSIFSAAVQMNGRIIIGGSFTNFDGTAANRIARLTSTGALDATFNAGTGPNTTVNTTALLPDGKVLIGGSFTSISGTTINRIARLTSAGALDATFTPGTAASNVVRCIALQIDGKIIIGGDFGTYNGATRNCIARLNANGSVESTSTFGIGTGAGTTIQTLNQLPDGSLWIGGNFTTVRGATRNRAARLFNAPASQTLTSPDPSSVQWQLTGTFAELSQVTFELSTDGGTVWTPLGSSQRINGSWISEGLGLPNSGKVRARGRPVSGTFGGSAGYFEQTVDLTPTPALTWIYNDASEEPVTSNGYTPNGAATLALNFKPETGTSLTVVNNTANRFINGTFPNLVHGQLFTLTFNSIGYDFLVNYFGGTGNDLVLEWADRRPVAWGADALGELGNNSTAARYLPVPQTTTGVLAGKRILRSVAGQHHGLALCSDGTLAAWGDNTHGQLGNNSTTSSLVPVLVDQTGVLTGKTIVALAAGNQHSLVLCADGTLAAWGANANGELGDGSTTERIVPVLVDQTGVFTGKTISAIAVGASHNLALCADSTLVAWGLNSNGQLGNNSITASSSPVLVDQSGVLAGKILRGIAAGSQHSLVMAADGSAAAWGANADGQLGDSTTVESHVPVLVVSNGALTGKIISAIAAGAAHNIALCTDGTLVGWGDNAHGQIGDASLTDRSAPVLVLANGALAGHAITNITAGTAHSLAFGTEGYVFTWGRNQVGQLGNNKRPLHMTVPVFVSLDSFASGESFLHASSGSMAEHNFGLVAKPVLGPQIVVEQPVNTRLADGTSTVAFHARTSSKQDITFTLRNTGVLPLTGLGITIDGADAGSFSVVTQPATPRNPGTSTTFIVRFSPTSNGMKNAVLHIPSNDLDETPFDIALTGNTPVVNFDFGTKTISEAATSVTIPVRLSAPAGVAFTIPVTYGGTALKGTDYTAPAVVSFSATAAEAKLVIAVKEDTLNEGDETITATLGTPSTVNAALGAGTLFTLTVTDDEIAPVISPQPLSQIVGIGDPVSFVSGTSAGSAPLTLQWKRGSTALAGATSGTLNIASASLADATAYTLTASNPKAVVISNIAQLAVVDTAARILRFNAGTSPKMTVSAAGNGLTYRWSKGATQLNNDAKHAGVTTKTLTVKTITTGDAGIYTCLVTAPGGTKTSGTFELQVPSQIPVTNQPVLPDGVLNNAWSYQLTFDNDATRAPTKFECVNLPSGLTCNLTTGLISGTPKATGSFTVTVKLSNLSGPAATVQDTMIVSAIPLTTVGAYAGLVARHATVNEDLGGRIDITTTTNGSFSASLKLGGTALPSLNSTLLTAPTAGAHPQRTLTIARKGKSALVLSIDLDPLTNALTGTVQVQGEPTSAAITGWRNTWRTTAPLNPVTTRFGLHAFEIEPDAASNGRPDVPQGCGYGTVKVTAAGVTTVVGRSADGGVINCTGVLGPNGEVIIYQPLSSNRASLHGTLTIAADANHSIDSTLTWKKHAMTTNVFDYKAGFDLINLNVFGGRYFITAPVLGLPVTAIGTNNARLIFGEGGIGTSATNPNVSLRISNTNSATLPSAGTLNPGKITKLKLNTATGAFSGTMILTDGTVLRTVPFQGQLVPTEGRGFGYFLLPKLADPAATPPTTLKTSPILSGWVALESL